MLGADHPNTNHARLNFARLLVADGKASEALLWIEATLAAREKALGENHPLDQGCRQYRSRRVRHARARRRGGAAMRALSERAVESIHEITLFVPDVVALIKKKAAFAKRFFCCKWQHPMA